MKNFVKTKKKLISFVLVLGAVTALHFPGLAQVTELMLLVEKVSKQLDSHSKYDNWKASVTSITTKMDKNWKPQKVTTVKKIIKVFNKERTEEIIQALETEKGKTKDITEKYIKKAIKKCEVKHIQQIAYSSYHDAFTQICFGCMKIRTSMKREDVFRDK